ncbi:MAG TPA: Holliday junction resolvase RuvX [Actinomycetota bacterium]|nr:Holliday junction resolvase RuvX [Actinomycetota bacterium]
MAEPGRVLGLDLGDARIGVAISDEARRMAVPLGTVRTGAPADVRAIGDLIQEHGVTLVVVGHPLLLSGEAGERAHHAERFGGAIEKALGVPVRLQDERLSTVEADRALRESGTSGRDRRRRIDRSAATVILQAWLDTDRHV